MAHDDRRWYVASTKSGRELQARGNLLRQGYEVFLPVQRRTVRHARRQTEKLFAYFPGYLFICLNLQRERWRPIESTAGVLRMIKARAAPLPAPVGLVEHLQSRADDEGVLADLGGSFQPGQTVRITGGPFLEQLAVVDRMSGEHRVRVLLSLMGQELPVEIDRRHLEGG